MQPVAPMHEHIHLFALRDIACSLHLTACYCDWTLNQECADESRNTDYAQGSGCGAKYSQHGTCFEQNMMKVHLL
jgi:hypothetical protein